MGCEVEEGGPEEEEEEVVGEWEVGSKVEDGENVLVGVTAPRVRREAAKCGSRASRFIATQATD